MREAGQREDKKYKEVKEYITCGTNTEVMTCKCMSKKKKRVSGKYHSVKVKHGKERAGRRGERREERVVKTRCRKDLKQELCSPLFKRGNKGSDYWVF